MPHGHYEQALVLRERIHGVEHLDRDQDGETHCRSTVRHSIREHFTTNFGEEVRTLMEVGLYGICVSQQINQ
jgi:hypothetical protein